MPSQLGMGPPRSSALLQPQPPFEHPLPEGRHPLTPPLGADGLQLSKPHSEGEKRGTRTPPRTPSGGEAAELRSCS